MVTGRAGAGGLAGHRHTLVGGSIPLLTSAAACVGTCMSQWVNVVSKRLSMGVGSCSKQVCCLWMNDVTSGDGALVGVVGTASIGASRHRIVAAGARPDTPAPITMCEPGLLMIVDDC